MRRHPFDAVSFVAGLVFVGAAAIGLTDVLTLSQQDLRWVGPALIVVFGLTLLLTAGRRRDEAPAEAYAGQSTATGPGYDDPDRDAAGLGDPDRADRADRADRSDRVDRVDRADRPSGTTE